MKEDMIFIKFQPNFPKTVTGTFCLEWTTYSGKKITKMKVITILRKSQNKIIFKFGFNGSFLIFFFLKKLIIFYKRLKFFYNLSSSHCY